MSPTAVNGTTTRECFENDLHLSILGLGAEYPPFRVTPDSLETIANRFYPPSIAMKKVLSINRYTGIDARAAIGTCDYPLVNQPTPPSIAELNDLFREEGVGLSVKACKKAINEWGGNVSEITHVVSTTCTNSANPGFDYYVAQQLGLRPGVEKILLHGIGCSGGLAAIRAAANLALGSSFRKKPARILVLACEISTVMVRSELDSIDKEQRVRIGACLFSDCASACVLSNGIGEEHDSPTPIYELLGWKHGTLEDTAEDLGFNVDPLGWKVVLSPRVPALTAAAVPPAFQDLLNSIPALHSNGKFPAASDFDWALHPGGASIMTGVEQAMNVTVDHLRASYEIYVNCGNSSSASIMAVMDQLRNMGDGRENVVACAFGPGISLEMMMLRRPKPIIDGLLAEDVD